MDSALETSSEYFQNKPERFDLNPAVIVDAFTRCLPNFIKDTRGKILDYGSAISGLMGWASTYDAGSSNDRKLLGEYFRRFADVSADYTDILSLHDQSLENRVTLATLNQRLAQDYYTVTGPHAAPEDQKNAKLFYEIANAFSSHKIKFGQELIQRLNAARGQAAVMRLLNNGGCEILVPDPDDPDEIKRWDVQAGVDFAAITPGNTNALLINMKSQKYTPDSQIVVNTAVLNKKIIPDLHNIVIEDIRKGKKMNHPLSGVRLEIQVPSDVEYIDPIGRLVDPKLGDLIINQLQDYIHIPYAKAA